jgi:hypothetical protein
MRLSLNGELLLVQNTKWKNVSGAWYHEHADLTFYVKGHVRVHQEKSFSPAAVLPANPADQSVATLTLVNDAPRTLVNNHASYEVYPDGGSYADDGSYANDYCPLEIPICEWFQGANPIPILNGVISEIGGVFETVSIWLGGVEAGAASDPDVVTLAETVQLGIEAIGNPSWWGVATAFAAAESGGWTGAVLDDLISEVVSWVLDSLVFMMM